MTSLMEILKQGASEQNQEQEVIFSTRFKNADGSPAKAKIIPLSAKQNNEYRKQATQIMKKGKYDFDQGKYFTTIILEHTVDPDFKDAKAIADMGCQTAEQLLDKLLNAGEVEALSMAILEASGLGQSLEELKDQVKN